MWPGVGSAVAQSLIATFSDTDTTRSRIGSSRPVNTEVSPAPIHTRSSLVNASVEGTLTVAIGGINETLNRGDSLFFQADADHGFANRTSAPCEYIMVISRRT
ncbi:cupin domain-containing protein [Streptosporangium sandarakinum]|uniref:cupin domain-containing protein n=1 Tax=Streptosporangium sandarakinum TaxID=1260955 RepID=UPI0037218DC2